MNDQFDLHDEVLESVELDWKSGEAVLRICAGDPARPRVALVASAVRRLHCERMLPWGFSEWINSVTGPTMGEDGVGVLDIEMQSGDVIRIEAGAFSLRDVE